MKKGKFKEWNDQNSGYGKCILPWNGNNYTNVLK